MTISTTGKAKTKAVWTNEQRELYDFQWSHKKKKEKYFFVAYSKDRQTKLYIMFLQQ